MTNDDLSYRDKIKDMLNKVTNNEDIYSKPQPEPEIHKKLKENGLGKTIKTIFFEEYQLEEYESESSLRYEDTNFFRVEIPSDYYNADTYWEEVIPLLRNIGDSNIDPDGEAVISIGDTGNGKEKIKVELCRDEDHGNRSCLVLYYLDNSKMKPAEAKNILEKVGLGVNDETIEVHNGKIFLQAIV